MSTIKKLTDVPEIAQYLRRIKAEERGLLTAVVKEKRGKYWRDLARIKFNRMTGEIWVSDDQYAPNDMEKNLIENAIKNAKWPDPVKVKQAINLPKDLAETHPDNIFEFRDEHGDLVMLQQRLDPRFDHEEKRYVPWTFWSDGVWRAAEPDEFLPIYGLDTIGNNTTVFIHEGAKAARAVQRMIERNEPHPWLEELKQGAHLGWSGGALNPYRTDWSILTSLGIKRAYIVSDNDKPGREAIAPISMMLRFQTFHVQFTDEWPTGFDLADSFPEEMFRTIDGKQFYNGPSFDACVHPATWMTDSVPQPRGRPVIMLRPHAREEWFYIPSADMYVNIDRPQSCGNEKVVNNMLMAFSHSNDTCKLINHAYSGRMSKLCYRPDIPGRKVVSDGTSAINMHMPAQIKATKGDPSPFLRFMEYLIVREEERFDVLRWCATLIAKPEIRMIWALLLISETQGVGKSTLSSHILAPLVGYQNVGFPTEDDIVESAFNSWMANKRLVVVSEIYSGHSWKAYNRLKNYVTEMEIMVNEKNQKRYKTDNWAHFLACSNSVKAMKVEDSDRRWMLPECVEVPWPDEKFRELRNWLNSGGLGIIKYWAENFGHYVLPGEKAPMTRKKKEMIISSRTSEEVKAAALAERIVHDGVPVVIGTFDLEAWAKQEAKGRTFATAHDLRKAMQAEGMITFARRLRVQGNLQYVSMSPTFYEAHRELLQNPEGREKELAAIVRQNVKHPSEFASMD
jgi:hypothetical protein